MHRQYCVPRPSKVKVSRNKGPGCCHLAHSFTDLNTEVAPGSCALPMGRTTSNVTTIFWVEHHPLVILKRSLLSCSDIATKALEAVRVNSWCRFTEYKLCMPMYDWIIVGAGSAGSLLANRLVRGAARGKKILILEAGGAKPSSLFQRWQVFSNEVH